jgi:hypothetical protein
MLDIAKNSELAVAQLGSTTTAYAFGQVLDISKAGRDIGAGQDLFLVIDVDSTSAVPTTGATFSISLVTTDTEPANTAGVIASGGVAITAPVTIVQSPQVASAIVTSTGFVIGQKYQILTVGTTDYTLIGASASTIGIQFVATGAGLGTGTAYDVRTLAGNRFFTIQIPPALYRRYLCLQANYGTVLNNTKFNAFLTAEPNLQRIYAQGLSVASGTVG